MHLWRIRLHCFQHIDHRWQWLPLDLHEFQGILGDIATFGSHRDHCFSGIAHLVDSDCMLDDRLGTEGCNGSSTSVASRPVNTAWTPGTFLAALVSILT